MPLKPCFGGRSRSCSASAVTVRGLILPAVHFLSCVENMAPITCRPGMFMMICSLLALFFYVCRMLLGSSGSSVLTQSGVLWHSDNLVGTRRQSVCNIPACSHYTCMYLLPVRLLATPPRVFGYFQFLEVDACLVHSSATCDCRG